MQLLCLGVVLHRSTCVLPVECDQYSKTLPGKLDLKKHVQIHSGENPYVCAYIAVDSSNSEATLRD